MVHFGPTLHLLVVDYAILLDHQIFVVLVFLLLGRQVFVLLLTAAATTVKNSQQQQQPKTTLNGINKMETTKKQKSK
ncbi:hypothetical protein T05_9110 [Trichinella murrelli]|nr:hypothetical protein T05_9110 [Trichinella murrelli]